MLLTGGRLRDAVEKRIRIDPFRESNLGPDSYDITLGNEFLRVRSEETGVIDPENLNVLGERILGREFFLQPGHFVLARSEEWIELPGNILALVSGKSSIARLGLQVHAAAVLHPGHRGYVVLEISNLNTVPFKLVASMKIAQLLFFDVEPVEEYYRQSGSTFGKQERIELPKKLGFSR